MTPTNTKQLSEQLMPYHNAEGGITVFSEDMDEFEQMLEAHEQAVRETASFVYVITAYDEEKERLGEIRVVSSVKMAKELYEKFGKVYKPHNVTMASRKIDSEYFNMPMTEALSQGNEEEKEKKV